MKSDILFLSHGLVATSNTSEWGSSHMHHLNSAHFSSHSVNHHLHTSIILLSLIVLLWILIREWWWIDFTKGVDPDVIGKAKNASKESARGSLSASLPFTEKDFRNVLLYDHIRIGQIDPRVLRRMKRKYLNYIAGMDFVHPDLIEPKLPDETPDQEKKRHEAATKIQGNVSRAKYELSIRNLFWATLITAIAALGGSFIGGLFS